MSKSSSGGLFGRHHTNTIALVDAPITESYARKARLTFYVAGLVGALIASVILSHQWHPILGALGGALIGAAVGMLAALLVLVWPFLRAIWHWADAIGVLLLFVFVWPALMQATNTILGLLIVAVLVGVPAAVGPIRRPLVALMWCAISRHRLRLAFARIIRTGTRNHPGHSPFILLARPTPAGERVWVWLRPGLDLSMVEAEIGRLAVTCWADSVRVVRANRTQAALIRVDIGRRDPLTAMVTSPLPGLLPGFDPAVMPVSPGMPPLGLDLPDVPETDLPTAGRPPRRPRPSGLDEPTA